ncbi:MAG: membrane protein insertase YidC [Paludibacteraceae bacterium]|nr:membrane protein insertase YidC [Paludibacteraceae bacterium]MBQ6748127.1 membrane protein insertase YidC [Paludibacteraceae bacterium]MBR0064169.1 membrane protein insertase YidC [Paludibacteraceae bacterium]
MDKNTWIGFLLIAAIIVGFSMLNRPSKEQLAERQRIQDSINVARMAELEAQRLSDSLQLIAGEARHTQTLSAEQQQERIQAAYGTFASAAQGEEQWVTLQNEHLRLTLSTLGGRIERAELLDYHASGDSINPLCLFRGDEASFALTLITANNRILQTSNLYFTPVETGASNKAVLRLPTASADAWLDFIYELSESYMVHFAVEPHNMQTELAQNVNSLELRWQQLIPQQEQGRKFEERYAQLQYMLVGGDMEKLSESKDDSAKESARVKWIGYKDQFFSTVLIADDAFSSSQFTSTMQGRHSGYIKEYTTHTSVPFDLTGKSTTGMRWYLGPNHYHTLKAYDNDVEREDRLYLNKLVPLGWKIVSWINTALVIPMFDLFTGWGLHIGIVILLMTIVIKLIILPFVFVSYKSSAKMRALKPQIDAINEKYPAEKMQERQAATMQLYQQAGVSPMSGCLPMLFQFPVLMAMFWFLPTAIELRGKSLLWAPDLSTYDAVFHWGFNIPLLGDHLSLFCLLMTITNIVYTYITMQSQATDPNMKFMKYMMYAMPLMFLFIFNDYAAGLSYYYLVSLFFTIFQTMIFRWTLDDKKMLAEIEANKKKKAGKPKSGFMERLEKMQREQQRMARENAKKANRR